MGQTHSTQAAYKKIIAEGKLTLPVGSEVERLFYEDFKYDPDAKVVSTPTVEEYDPEQFDPALRKRLSAAPLRPTFLRPASIALPPRPVSISNPQRPVSSANRLRPVSTSETNWTPVVPEQLSSNKSKERLKLFPPGEEPFLSPDFALRRTGSDKMRGSRVESSLAGTTYETGDERWKERLRRRVSDSRASEQEKKRLSRLSGGSQLSSDLSPEEDE